MRTKPASLLREANSSYGLISPVLCVCVCVSICFFVQSSADKAARGWWHRGRMNRSHVLHCKCQSNRTGPSGGRGQLQPTEAQRLTANRRDWQIVSSPGFTVLCLIMKWASATLGERAEIRLKSSQVRFIDRLGVEVRGQPSWVTQWGFTSAKKAVMKGKILFYILSLAGEFLGRKGITYSK